jgi:hypothetical protein
VHNLCHDIKTARRSIAQKQESHRYADDNDVAKHVKQRVIRQGLKIGKHPLKHADERGNYNGGVNGFCTKLRTNEDKPDNEEQYVDDEVDKKPNEDPNENLNESPKNNSLQIVIISSFASIFAILSIVLIAKKHKASKK